MGPGSTWLGSQSSVPDTSRHGAEPSGGGLGGGARAAAQLVGHVAVEALVRVQRRQHAARRVVGELEGVEDRLDARVVAVRVVVGGARPPKSRSQPVISGVYGPDELEHGLEALQRLAAVAEGRRGDALQRRAARAWPRPGRCRAPGGARAGAGRGPSAWPPPASGRRSRRNGARSFVAGLDSATSTSRSSSVARRLTKVVLARRSVVGSSPSASTSATFSEPIARGGGVRVADERREVVALARPASSSAGPVSTMKRVSAASSSVSSPTSRREVDSSGLKYSAASPASSSLPSYWVAKPLTTSWSEPRVCASSVLKIWSRSTTDVVAFVVEHRAVVELGRVAGPHGQRDVAVGDARQRGQPDRRLACPRAAARTAPRPSP